jgi:predicted Zn finger-like uncharacterized protein
MKFLCRNCKAKYQIADDKVAGRTLRMTCQQCGENITVRGPGSAASPISAPMGGGGPIKVPSAAPSALGADFKRQVAAPAPEATPRAGIAEWHVAINDVPVGPMRRDEVARKIAAGAVDREALAWREGMDDWTEVKHIPELLALFPLPPAAAMPQAMPQPMAPPAPVQPAARVEMAPIGARQVMSLDDYAQPLEIAAPAIAVSPLASAPPPAASNENKPLGWAQMFALVSGGAVILTAGMFLQARVLAPPAAAPPPQAAVAAAPVAAAPVAVDPEEEASGRTIELDMQAIDGQSGSNPARRTGTSAGTGEKKPTTAGGKALTEEQKAMLARMGGGNLNEGPNLRAPGEATKPSGGSGGTGQLTAQQLSEVVLRGRKNLQRCYEVALRGANSDETVRMDVDITISANGNVTNANISGKGLPGMDECIKRTVRMWRFPSSGESTQTRFPVVFQPGG